MTTIVPQIQKAANEAIATARESYRKERPERYGAEVIVSPEELLAGVEDARARISFHMQRMTRDAVFTMLSERWARPGAPLFSYEIDTPDSAFGRRPSYGPGTLRLRLDMATHAADMRLPEANAVLTRALIGALAIISTGGPTDLAKLRLLEDCRKALRKHGSPEIIALLDAMVATAEGRNP